MKAHKPRFWPKLGNVRPVCWGTGLLALDLVIGSDKDTSPRMWAGGSFGNVNVILKYLGWRVAPIAKIGIDPAGNRIVSDLSSWKVPTSGIARLGGVRTPIIIERISIGRPRANGHRFEWRCPQCGSWFPRFRPLSEEEVTSSIRKLPKNPTVVYLDRASKGSVLLAQKAKELGALVAFEPSKVGTVRLFNECLRLADILKYSHERMGHFPESSDLHRIPLIVETLGSGGLRYRVASTDFRTPRWSHLPAYPVQDFRDAAGAGDWCTAGLLQIAAARGRQRFLELSDDGIEGALGFGQALASVNCAFIGARGAMYSLPRARLESSTVSVWNGTAPAESAALEPHRQAAEAILAVCPSCD